MLHSELGKVFGEWQELHVHLPIHLLVHFHFALPRVLTETSPEVREGLLRQVPALPTIKQNSHLHIYRHCSGFKHCGVWEPHSCSSAQTTLLGKREQHSDVRETEAVVCHMPCKVMKRIPLSKILISCPMLWAFCTARWGKREFCLNVAIIIRLFRNFCLHLHQAERKPH